MAEQVALEVGVSSLNKPIHLFNSFHTFGDNIEI